MKTKELPELICCRHCTEDYMTLVFWSSDNFVLYQCPGCKSIKAESVSELQKLRGDNYSFANFQQDGTMV